MPVMTQNQTESDMTPSLVAKAAGSVQAPLVDCVFDFQRTAATVSTGFQSANTTKLAPVFCTGSAMFALDLQNG